MSMQRNIHKFQKTFLMASTALTRPAAAFGAAALALGGGIAHADPAANTLPTGGNVVGGGATINQSGNRMDVNQSTGRTVIDWRNFDIGKNAHVNFNQPNSNAIAANRVNGSADPTKIHGQLTANGHVWILNPNGVMFGASARVDVSGIVASTANINVDRFMAGDMRLHLQNGGSGSVINNGSITVRDAGLAAFVAPHVANNGTIHARLGKVTLASGTAFTLDLAGDRLVEIGLGAEGGLVEQAGDVIAEGGIIEISAQQAGAVVDSIINVTGYTSAASAEVAGGEIILGGGEVNVAGTLDASGATGGGSIDVNGKTINTADTAVLKADATEHGDGGSIIAFADDKGTYAGSFSAQGGASGGDGGFVETSGKKVSIKGNIYVNTLASKGQTGDWSIDPDDLTVVAGTVGSIGSEDSEIGADTIVTRLDTTNVNLFANDSITVEAEINTVGQSSGTTLALNDQDGGGLEINLDAAILLDASQTLIGQGTEVNVASTGLIQNGVDVAATDATVNVAAGTYNENVVINKAGLTLLSTAQHQAVIDAGGSGFAVDISKEHGNLGTVTIDGFKVVNWNMGGINQSMSAADLATLHVFNNEIVGLAGGSTQHGNGIQVSGDNSIVRGNYIHDIHLQPDNWSASGVLVVNASNVLVENNTIDAADLGIAVSGWGGAAANNIIHDNVVTNSDAAISIQANSGDVTDTVITDNTLTNNEYGVSLEDYDSGFTAGVSTFSGNTFGNNEVHVSNNAGTNALADILSDNIFDKTVHATGGNTVWGDIQPAIDGEAAGSTLNMSADTFDLASILDIDKALALTGAGQGLTTINAAANGYGIHVTANDVSLSNFTLNGPTANESSSYGIKVNPAGPGGAERRLTNFNISDVTIQGSGRSELDLNGVNGANITNVIANGQNTAGVGIAIGDSANVTVTGSSTSGNDWGGVALYQANRDFDQQTTGIDIDDTNTFAEINPVYLEDESATEDFGTLNIEGFDFAVRNPVGRDQGDGDEFTWLQATQQVAIDFAMGSYEMVNTASSSIQGWTGSALDGIFTVGVSTGGDAMSIQAAVDAANSGNVINVLPGDYEEGVTNVGNLGGAGGGQNFGLHVYKDGLTLRGVDASGNVITDADNVLANITAGYQTGFGAQHFVSGNSVTVEGLGFKPVSTGNNKTFEVIGDAFTMRNSVIDNSGNATAANFYISDFVLGGGRPLVESFTLEGNKFISGTTSSAIVVVGGGVGRNTGAENRIFDNNILIGNGLDGQRGFQIQGRIPDLAWQQLTAGAVTVTNNTFEDVDAPVRTVGILTERLAWNDIFRNNGNVFSDGAVMVFEGDTDVVRAVLTDDGGEIYEDIRINSRIQPAVDATQAGDTVVVQAGTYDETVGIDHGLTIAGAGQGLTVINGAVNINGHTAASLPVDGVTLSDFTINAGNGQIGVLAYSNSVDGIYNSANISVNDVTVNMNNSHGFGLFDVNGAVLTRVTVNGDGSNFAGVEGIGVTGLTINGSNLNNANIGLNIFDVGGYEANGGILLSNTSFSDNNTHVRLASDGVALTGSNGSLISLANDETGIVIDADNVSVSGMEIAGLQTDHYTEVDWEPASNRPENTGISIRNGSTGVNLSGNEIRDMRTALFSGDNTGGDITGNVIENTKGGFLLREDGTAYNISGNETGPNGNEWDIVYELNTNPTGNGAAGSDRQAFLLDASLANNGMKVLDRSFETKNRTHVEVDDDSTATAADDFNYGNGLGNERQPLQTIQSAFDALVAGGFAQIAGGTYAESAVATDAVNLAGSNVAVDGLTLNGTGSTIQGNLSSNGTGFSFGTPIVLTGNLSLTTTGGAAITTGAINGSAAGGQTLTVNAAGPVSMGSLGATTRLGATNIGGAGAKTLTGSTYNANSLTFSGPVTLTQALTTFNSTQSGSAAGNITFNGDIFGTADGAQSVNFIAGNGAGAKSSNGDVTIQNAGTEAVRLGDMIVNADDFSAATVWLAADYSGTMTGNQTFTDETLNAGGNVDSNVGGNASGPVNSGGNVNMGAGGNVSGNISGNNVTVSGTNVNSNINATNNANVTAQNTYTGSVNANSGTINANTVDADVNGGTFTVNANSGSVTGNGSVTSGGGAITVNGQKQSGGVEGEFGQIIVEGFVLPEGAIVTDTGDIVLPEGLAIGLISPAAGEGATEPKVVFVRSVQRLGALLAEGYSAIIIDLDSGFSDEEQEMAMTRSDIQDLGRN
ncbi:filamentous hemagglutinin N-terminal domain-containing protein [Tepidicaulis sp. LMO-SS28]|uniref:two-partner secretion domain-containing protein n=1 Tax=Tepidicaulis sp. LMO-SS28 TaxID=3447455 RepID=UPI003EDFA79A